MLTIALLIAACAHAAGDATFRPWALNDSAAFVFPRIAEKRNRGRRERLAAALRNDADAIAAALRAGVDWNSLGVAWPRGTLRRLPAAFAALVANGRADRAMLEMDHIILPMYSDGRRRLANADAAALDATGAALVDGWGLPSSVVDRIAKAVDFALENVTAARALRGAEPRGYVGSSLALGSDRVASPDLEIWLRSPRLTSALDAYLGAGKYVRTGVNALRLTDALKAPFEGGRPNLRGYLSGRAPYLNSAGLAPDAVLRCVEIKFQAPHAIDATLSPRSRLLDGAWRFYAYNDLKLSRFADSYVEENYEVTALTGPRGGGFLFNTNAIHKGRVDGARERTVVIADFIARSKNETLADIAFGGPCGQPRTAKARGLGRVRMAPPTNSA